MNKTKTIIISIATVLVLSLGLIAYYYTQQLPHGIGESTLIGYPSDSKTLTVTGSYSGDSMGCNIPFSSGSCQTLGGSVSWNSGMVGLDTGREIGTIYAEYSASAGTAPSCGLQNSCSGKNRLDGASLSISCMINGVDTPVGSLTSGTSGQFTTPAGCYFIKSSASASGIIAKCCSGSSCSTISQAGKVILIPKSYSAKTKTEDIKGATSIGCN
jgi:hypothetical protein